MKHQSRFLGVATLGVGKERRVVYQGGKKRRYNRFAYELVAFPPSIDFSCT